MITQEYKHKQHREEKIIIIKEEHVHIKNTVRNTHKQLSRNTNTKINILELQERNIIIIVKWITKLQKTQRGTQLNGSQRETRKLSQREEHIIIKEHKRKKNTERNTNTERGRRTRGTQSSTKKKQRRTYNHSWNTNTKSQIGTNVPQRGTQKGKHRAK